MSSIWISKEGEIARTWWRALAGRESPDAKAAVAALARASTALEAMLVPAAMDLVRRIARSRNRDEQVRAAELAALLARVRTEREGRTLAHVLGGADPKDRRIGADRWRHLMLASDGPDRLDAFIGLLRRVRNEPLDIGDLATGYLHWDHPTNGERTRITWNLRFCAADDYVVDGEDLGAAGAEDSTLPPSSTDQGAPR